MTEKIIIVLIILAIFGASQAPKTSTPSGDEHVRKKQIFHYLSLFIKKFADKVLKRLSGKLYDEFKKAVQLTLEEFCKFNTVQCVKLVYWFTSVCWHYAKDEWSDKDDAVVGELLSACIDIIPGVKTVKAIYEEAMDMFNDDVEDILKDVAEALADTTEAAKLDKLCSTLDDIIKTANKRLAADAKGKLRSADIIGIPINILDRTNKLALLSNCNKIMTACKKHKSIVGEDIIKQLEQLRAEVEKV